MKANYISRVSTITGDYILSGFNPLSKFRGTSLTGLSSAEASKINGSNLLNKTYFGPDLLRKKSFVGQISLKIFY